MKMHFHTLPVLFPVLVSIESLQSGTTSTSPRLSGRREWYDLSAWAPLWLELAQSSPSPRRSWMRSRQRSWSTRRWRSFARCETPHACLVLGTEMLLGPGFHAFRIYVQNVCLYSLFLRVMCQVATYKINDSRASPELIVIRLCVASR